MADLKQPKTLQPQVVIEDEDLWNAIEAELDSRGGVHTKTDGLRHAHLADLIREALTDYLGVGA